MTDLTQLELSAINDRFILADAHTHQRQSTAQSKIVDRLPELWRLSESQTQRASEQLFIQSFMSFRGQNTAAFDDRNLLNYSASCSMTVLANLCHKRNWKVALLQPTFDNLFDILKNFSVDCIPFSSLDIQQLKNDGIVSDQFIEADVWMFVEPNNPTNDSHFLCDEPAFLKLIDAAAKNNKVLAFDFCFASFLNPYLKGKPFDAYEILDQSKVSYLAIEDTGKIWPTQDAKVSILRCSADLKAEVFDIHSTYILNVSPFVLNVCSEYVRLSCKDNLGAVAKSLNQNRHYAMKILENPQVALIEGNVPTSVMWFRLNGEVSTKKMCDYLSSTGVHILPGSQFYWNKPSFGDKYFRVALARDRDRFCSALDATYIGICNFLS